MPGLDETFPIIERCMFASNFPVDRLVGGFEVIYSGLRRPVADLPTADQRKLFDDNAERVYRLSGAPRRGGRA